ncbi:MAG: outer membrane protein assembly factor BamC [Proteobacteria bacterium]|nr:outer membrane protein assembly factor BamC [Pseudomonadota bacterium]
MTNIEKSARGLVLLTIFCGVSACGYIFGDDGVFRDPAEDYKKAPETSVITVPEGKNSNFSQEIYAIPYVEDSLILEGEFEVPRPTPLVAGESDEIVRIQKLGDQTWALVAMAPGEVWPQVRSFVTASGLQIARVDARSGIMESGWVQLQDQPMAARFRFRIEQGVQRGSSELHVLQMSQVGDVENWPAKSDNLELESEMLRGVAQYIANSTDAASVSMVADQALSASGKISLQEAPEGYTFVRVGLPFSRAWASLARALQRATFEITDRDRSTGLYYVKFIGPSDEDGAGWFDWLFGEEEHPLAGRDFRVTMTEENERQVIIRIKSQEGSEPLTKREEQGLLTVIKGSIN